MLAALGAGRAVADIEAARYDMPTEVYGHGVLPGGEYAGLEVRLTGGRVIGVGTFEAVYEDTAPRLVDLDGDGENELITVISYFEEGSAVRIFDEVPSEGHPRGTTIAVVAETPPIGTRHRWLGIVGAADLDGDGQVEIAYVDRPHLARVLRIWRYRDGTLEEVARLPGVTNHRIGMADISGGIRRCGGRPEIIMADAAWRRIVAVRLQAGALTARDAGPYRGNGSIDAAMAC
ncbi:hypothetical protein BOO69_05860 [Sulfitobacter alexandrii]|uniref:VCBS repeat-containing protein n=1 Tax=Sulfitobacter alexandrii TaxID=1917485 RepID=A0A1J0WM18_9RHOB|nr:hypothetical protein [Sulfitobacter alexandrii]APE45323.1 hypothetical protein BOO69_05860 [Sulfitobacter alexandrii]